MECELLRAPTARVDHLRTNRTDRHRITKILRYLGTRFALHFALAVELIFFDNIHNIADSHDALFNFLDTLLGITSNRCAYKVIGYILLLY